MTETDQGNKIFGDIALSLSGGGYRAAAFHLGTLDMLNELKLLEDVTILSTVSGGTIVGVSYAAAVSQGLLFNDFKEKFYSFLLNTNVISDALSGLKKSIPINGSNRMPSLIRAAAQIYTKNSLLGNKDLRSLSGTRFRDQAFNATDFRTGISFRFQISTNKLVRSGNNNSEIDLGINEIIRLADVVAASSCFPSGFEPIRFPSDFTWPKGFSVERVRSTLGTNFAIDIPLMDGGVFDNQGIDSIKNIYDRKNTEIGVFIISDTSPRRTKLFEFPAKKRKGKLPLWLWFLLIVLLFVAAIFSMTTILMDAVPLICHGEFDLMRGISLYLIPFLFSSAVFILIIYAAVRLSDVAKKVREKTGIRLWKYLRVLSLPEVIEFARSRIDSVIEMISNVFMKRIRSLGYTSVFSDPKFQEKLIPNLIYDLDNEERWGNEITEELKPSTDLRSIATRAESYETNLWFLNEKDLNNLIDCGRATICFKILKYLLKQRSPESGLPGTPEFSLLEKVKREWSNLNGKSEEKA
jgi:predicted acylesterase/phospholipase RssA